MSYLDVMVLVTLARQPAHGYEIRRKVEDILAGQVSLNPNVLYPMLRRYEAMGAVAMRVEAQRGRPPRHVYELTARGREVLDELIRDFGLSQALSEAEFRTRVAFFDLLGPEDRLAILGTRQEALTAKLGQLAGFRGRVAAGSWGQVVLEHAIEEMELERRWVAGLRRRVAAESPQAASVTTPAGAAGDTGGAGS